MRRCCGTKATDVRRPRFHRGEGVELRAEDDALFYCHRCSVFPGPGGVQGSKQMLRVGRSGRADVPESLGDGERDVEREIVVANRLGRLRVVAGQKVVEANAVGRVIMVYEREAKQVRREASEVDRRVGLPAGLETIEIEEAVGTIVD